MYWRVSVNTQGIVLVVFVLQYLCCILVISVLNLVAFLKSGRNVLGTT